MKKIFNITDKKEIKDKKIYKGIIIGRKISKILKKENSIENKKSKIKFKNENIKDKKFNGIIRKSKIKFRLIISYSILVLIPLLIVGTTAVLQSKKSIDNKISNFSNQIMEQIGVNIYSEMNKASDFARTIIAEPQIQEYFNGNDNSVADYIKISELSKSIRSMISTQNNMTGVGIITEDNKKIGSFSNQLSDMLVKELQELSDEKKGKFVFSLNKSPSGYKIYGCAQAKSLETGGKFGTIIEEINPKLFVDLFKNVDLGKGSSIFVIDSDGLIVLSSNSSLIGTQYENVNLVEKIKENGISNGKKKDKYLSTDDGKELVAYSKLGDSDWYVLGSIPYSYLDRESNILKINTIIVSLISFLVAMIAALVIEKSISNPLKKLVLLMNEGKKGNLNLNIIDRSNDEIGEVITAFNGMLKKINALVSNVKELSEKVIIAIDVIKTASEYSSASSEEIGAAMIEIAEGTANQVINVNDGIACMNNLSNGIDHVNSKTKQVSLVIGETEKIKGQAIRSAEILKNKAEETKNVTGYVINDIKVLNSDIKNIRGIVELLSEIAEQTNLLALNAAIEAARAGEVGKGFAVVAEEVKKLADKSKKSSEEINKIIAQIESKSESVMEKANTSNIIIEEQMESVDKTDNAFNIIFESMNQIEDQIENMVDSIEEIVKSKDKTEESMENICLISEESAAMTKQVSLGAKEQIEKIEKLSEVSEELSLLAQTLNSAIDEFKVG